MDAAVIAATEMERFRNPAPSIRTGAILGSEWVVDSEEFSDFLLDRERTDEQDWTKRYGDAFDQSQQRWYNENIACLDMESYGFLRAIEEHRKSGSSLMHAFSIRGISDPCRNKKTVEDGSRKGIRKIAVENAVETLIDFFFYFAELDVGQRR